MFNMLCSPTTECQIMYMVLKGSQTNVSDYIFPTAGFTLCLMYPVEFGLDC